MSRSATQIVTGGHDRALEMVKQTGIVVAASVFVAACAHVTIPLPHTPVPLTVQNFAVVLVGLMLGSKRGFAALALYLAEGAAGLPVFNPLGPGGIAQIIGVTGGYLMVYPFVAALAGFLFERGRQTFARAATAGLLAEILLFLGGISWLYVATHSFAKAAYWGLYWFVAAEVLKVMFAAVIASGWNRRLKSSS
jgi:biotin transport system substrate-specific component